MSMHEFSAENYSIDHLCKSLWKAGMLYVLQIYGCSTGFSYRIMQIIIVSG